MLSSDDDDDEVMARYRLSLSFNFPFGNVREVPVRTVLLNARCQTRTGLARRGRRVSGKCTYVRAPLSCFQNMRRMAAISEPRTTVVFLRWRVGGNLFCVPASIERARQKQKMFRSDINYGPNFYTSPTLGVGGGVLCCIATALRGLGHRFRREMARSDKFVEQCDDIIKSWIT